MGFSLLITELQQSSDELWQSGEKTLADGSDALRGIALGYTDGAQWQLIYQGNDYRDGYTEISFRPLSASNQGFADALAELWRMWEKE